MRLLVATGNAGKVKEYEALAHAASAGGAAVEVSAIAEFPSLPGFEESAETFAENAAGKALHYSRLVDGIVIADDSGLVVEALGGAPGPKSARYAGAGATDGERMAKVLSEMKGKKGEERRAAFVCVLAAARKGKALAVVSDSVEGVLLEEARGRGGFGYDPIFYFAEAGKTFAELGQEEKNRVSHRGKAFRKMVEALKGSPRV